MNSSRSRVPLVLAIISVVSTPFLWFVQFFGMWMEGAIGSVVVIVAGALTLVLPVSAFATGRKAKTKAAQIIGGIVGAICLAWQVWVTLSITGVCVLLEGC
jgi:uncharacterized membrane protein